jgi:hypothetical protein
MIRNTLNITSFTDGFLKPLKYLPYWLKYHLGHPSILFLVFGLCGSQRQEKVLPQNRYYSGEWFLA